MLLSLKAFQSKGWKVTLENITHPNPSFPPSSSPYCLHTDLFTKASCKWSDICFKIFLNFWIAILVGAEMFSAKQGENYQDQWNIYAV